VRSQLAQNRARTRYAQLKPWCCAEAIEYYQSHKRESQGLAAVEDIVKLQSSVKELELMLRTMWQDMAVMRAYVLTRQHAAARVIQSRFRGWLARRRWRVMKLEYKKFQQKFLPFVLLLQEVGRRFLTRRRLLIPKIQAAEIRRLRNDVDELKSAVKELQRHMQTALRFSRASALDSLDSLHSLRTRRSLDVPVAKGPEDS
jgi:hypothetical protein